MKVNEVDYLYSIYENKLILKLKGYLQYRAGFSFDLFIDYLFNRPFEFNEIIVDLSLAEYIDSTNIGLIARIIKKSMQIFNKKITIISINDLVTKALVSVGIDKVSIFLDKNYFENFDGCGFTSIQECDIGIDSKPLAKLIYDAHSDLIDIDGDNYLKFKNLLELLQSEM